MCYIRQSCAEQLLLWSLIAALARHADSQALSDACENANLYTPAYDECM